MDHLYYTQVTQLPWSLSGRLHKQNKETTLPVILGWINITNHFCFTLHTVQVFGVIHVQSWWSHVCVVLWNVSLYDTITSFKRKLGQGTISNTTDRTNRRFSETLSTCLFHSNTLRPSNQLLSFKLTWGLIYQMCVCTQRRMLHFLPLKDIFKKLF